MRASTSPRNCRPARRRAALGVVVALLALWAVRSAEAQVVVRLDVEGTINPAVDDYLRDGFDRAEQLGAEAVLIRLDTPGGLVETTRSIVKQELAATVPVVVWVGPQGARAASAGVFITMAAHVAAMSPGTHIGAASPVMIGLPEPTGGDEDDEGDTPDNQETMRRKAMQDTRAFARSIAEARGRPADWIERTVTEADSATAQEALDAGAIDLIVDDEAALLVALDGREVSIGGVPRRLRTAGAQVVTVEMRLGQKILHLLAHPTLAYLLLLFGIVAVYFEISQPGGYVAGVLGAVALILAIMSLQILPFHVGGLLLVLLGVGLLIAEAFLPTSGALAVGGIAAMVLGGLLLFDTPELTLRPSPWAIGGVSVFFALSCLLIGVLVVRAQKAPARLGPSAMVGLHGEVLEALDPLGKVYVRGEIWDAELTAGGRLEAGAPVVVQELHGLTLRVKKGVHDRVGEEHPYGDEAIRRTQPSKMATPTSERENPDSA